MENKFEEPLLSGFEGPEKKLELDFKENPNDPVGFRIFDQQKLQELLDLAGCTILTKKSNTYFDAYVLSESSLFVYPNKIILKTCGTTTLLKCVDKLLELSNIIGAEIEYVFYSRKNFLYPKEQDFPHNDFAMETQYLNQIFDGASYVLGPLSGDHWFLYMADYSERESCDEDEQKMEIMMQDLDPRTMKQFEKSHGLTAKELTVKSGISGLLDEAVTDEHLFDPCGYSMNGLFGRYYETIHVTPEPHCSYVSYESNVPKRHYNALVASVLKAFNPGRFTITIFADGGSLAGDIHKAFSTKLDGFVLKNKTIYEFEGDYAAVLCNFQSVTCPSPKVKRRVMPSGKVLATMLGTDTDDAHA